MCASYAGRCDDSALSTKQKATLLWRCPRTCAGTDYADGGVAYCPCIAGHDCCFDEPPDCSTRRMTSVIEQVHDTTSTLRTVLLAQSHPQHAPAYLGPLPPLSSSRVVAVRRSCAATRSAYARPRRATGVPRPSRHHRARGWVSSSRMKPRARPRPPPRLKTLRAARLSIQRPCVPRRGGCRLKFSGLLLFERMICDSLL